MTQSQALSQLHVGGPPAFTYTATLFGSPNCRMRPPASNRRRMGAVYRLCDISRGDCRIGYIFFRNFVQPSYEALDIALPHLWPRAWASSCSISATTAVAWGTPLDRWP